MPNSCGCHVVSHNENAPCYEVSSEKGHEIIFCPRHSEANVTTLTAERDRFREALRKYGAHRGNGSDSCRPHRNDATKCVCGLAKILATPEGK